MCAILGFIVNCLNQRRSEVAISGTYEGDDRFD